MVEIMARRRTALALLAMVFVAVAAVPSVAAPRRHGVPRVTISAEGPGTLISLRYGSGAESHFHFLHASEALDRVAVTDIDNDGYVDILAAPRDGALLLWRNAGHGRFALASLSRGTSFPVTRGPRIARIEKMDDGWQWGDDHRHDAAMPRAPSVRGDLPVAAVRVTTPVYVRPASLRRFSSRAPPVL
jgi:hypothetical protein